MTTTPPKMPTIGIVIPCYNVQAYVEAAVDAALAQTYKAESVICVDDGSTDNTLQILGKLRNDGARIQVISQKNSGGGAARNAGMALIQSDYIQFLDSDDLIHPRKLEHQAKLIANSKEPPDLLAAAYEQIEVGDHNKDIPPTRISVHPDDWVGLVTTRIGITTSNLWKVDFLKKMGGWNEEIRRAEDAELTFRLLKNRGSVLRDPCINATLRRRTDSVWNRNLVASRRTYAMLLKEIWDYMSQEEIWTSERRVALEGRLFAVLRLLYRDDRELATRIHRQIFDSGFVPGDTAGTSLFAYERLYKIFGFRVAQEISLVEGAIARRWYAMFGQQPSRNA